MSRATKRRASWGDRPGWDRIALGAVALGALLRGWWVFVEHPPLDHVYSDMAGYVERALGLASGEPLERYDAF